MTTLDRAAVLADARRLARAALDEDGPTDITTDVTSATGGAEGVIRAREPLVVAGLSYGAAVAALGGCGITWAARDGAALGPGDAVGTVRGEAGALLRVERPLLNMVQRACGIATATRRYVEAVAGTPCRILHTRKTAPGLRLFDVAAVLAGGGQLHRLGLDRVVMLKDNHWAVIVAQERELESVVKDARRRGALAVQVEVESAAQVEAACRADADRLLIDNRSPEEFGDLATLARSLTPKIEIEATGGVTLGSVRAYAEAGADFVSIGALTHSARAADLTLEM
jgi:nicotinate-nucleotide pyrophosphorylase (carboxylating)